MHAPPPLKDLEGKERVETVRVAGGQRRYIEHRCLRYFYDDSEEAYTLLRFGNE